MKRLLVIVGAFCWLAVGSALVISTYQNNQQTIALQKVQQEQNLTKMKMKLSQAETQLNSTKLSLITVQTDKNQACVFAKDAQSYLIKYKIALALPTVCQ